MTKEATHSRLRNFHNSSSTVRRGKANRKTTGGSLAFSNLTA